MNTLSKTISAAILATLGLMYGALAAAAEPTAAKSPPMEASKEQRDKMAKAHEGAAHCLRSSRAISECRQEMMSSHTMMGEDGCKMMHGKTAQGEQAKPSKDSEAHKH